MEPENRFVLVLVGAVGLLAALNLVLMQQNKKVTDRETSRFTLALPANSAPEGYEKMPAVGETAKYVLGAETTDGLLQPGATFRLTTTESVSLDQVKAGLKSSVPVTVTASNAAGALEGDKKFKIVPNAPLGLGQIVKMTLVDDREYSWAWQTQARLAVTGTIPGDKANPVPVNTGIEIMFNQEDFGDPGSRITITPEIRFETQRRGKVWSIVPSQPLKPETIYKVTLAPGLSSASGVDPMAQGVTWEFQTEKPKVSEGEIWMDTNLVQVLPTEKAVLKVNTYQWNGDTGIKFEIYGYRSASQFAADLQKYDPTPSWYEYSVNNNPVDTAGLVQVVGAELKVAKLDQSEYSSLEYIQLPKELPRGFYLVQGKTPAGRTVRAWVESTYMAGYVAVGREQTTVWMNNLQTKGPIGSAQISIPGIGAVATTSNQGLAVFGTPKILHEPKKHYVLAQEGELEVVLPIQSLAGSSQAGTVMASDYWSYLYHERNLYKPTDTVNFWGMVKLRETGVAPGVVKVQMQGGYGSVKAVVEGVTFTPGNDGTYFGSLKFTDLPTGWYNLILTVGETQVKSAGFQVSEYQKPEMNVALTADKKAIFADETVNYSARVAFYDETPVRDVNMNVMPDYGDKIQVKTDESGQLKYAYSSKFSGDLRSYPRYESVGFIPALSQTANIPGYSGVSVYAARLQLKTESEKNGLRAKVKITANKTDLTELNSGKGWNVVGAVASGQKLSLKVVKSWYEVKETGTYYNFVEKLTRPKYSYTLHKETVATSTVTTDGNGKAEYEFDMENERMYEVTVAVEDNSLRTPSESAYFYPSDWGYKTNATEDSNLQLGLDREKNEYSLGEKVNVEIKTRGKLYQKSAADRFLYLVASSGRVDYFLADDPKLSFDFVAKYQPNAYVGAIAFTEKGFREVLGSCEGSWGCYYDYSGNYFDGVEVRYKKSDSRLEITQAFDKAKYLPGEKAAVTVTVMKNGVAVADAEVNLVLVDKALKDIGGVNPPDVLNTIYTPRSSLMYYTYYSHKPALPNVPQSEKGGGGGEVRQLFKDTAVFVRSRTDEKGSAKFEFTMPDNITTWLTYAQAVTAGLDAGQLEGTIIASKDYFMTANFPPVVLAKDKPYIGANSFGNGLAAGSTIAYEMEVGGQKVNKSGQAFTEAAWPMPILGVGKYKMTLWGQAGERRDGLVLPYEVIQTRENVQAAKVFTVRAGEKLAKPNLGQIMADQPVSVVVSDVGQGQFYWQLRSLCHNSSGNLENAVGRIAARKLLIGSFDYRDCPEGLNLNQWQTAEGGLGEVRWASSNLELTAWALSVQSADFSGNNRLILKNYLQNKSVGEVQMWAKWGLVSLGESEIGYFKQIADNLAAPVDQSIVAGLALAQAGDREGARKVFNQLVTNYGYTSKPYIRIQRTASISNPDQILKDTARALLLAAEVESPYAEGMYDYIRDYWVNPDTVTLNLALVSYVRQQMRDLPEEKTEIVLNGQIVELEDCRCLVRKLNVADLANFEMLVRSGVVRAEFSFSLDAAGIATAERDNRLTLNRTYQKVSGEGEIKPGDLVKVVLNPTVTEGAPLGGYEISDPLPSGLALIRNPGIYGLTDAGWVNETEVHKITAHLYHALYWKSFKPVVYYARAVAPGTYMAEPAVMQSRMDRSVMQITGSDQIFIATP